jgi:DNA replication protein DnaC
MTLADTIAAARRATQPGTPSADLINPQSPIINNQSPPPLCPCGAPVDPDLIDLRTLFPALYRPLCSACYEADRVAAEDQHHRQLQEAAHRHRLAELERLRIDELLATDIGDRRFNAALWVSVAGWTHTSGRWLVITGDAGRCKSRVVALLARRLILDHGLRVAWCRATAFQRVCEELWIKDKDIQKAAYAQLREWEAAQILILDDLGKNTWSDLIETKLFDLIDARKTQLRPTIITANTPLPELMPLMSKERRAPIIGRILEASAGWQLRA